jgi:hypothetical protein
MGNAVARMGVVNWGQRGSIGATGKTLLSFDAKVARGMCASTEEQIEQRVGLCFGQDPFLNEEAN